MANYNRITKSASYVHGHKSKDHESPTHRAWRSMLGRCRNTKQKSYPGYGGRGISVCESWHKFVNFLADMGQKPEGKSLDRIDNNGNYEAGNCRWATLNQQARNKRTTQWITHNGITKSVSDWADDIGIKAKTLKKRLATGWTVDRALTTKTLSIYEISKLGAIAQWGDKPQR